METKTTGNFWSANRITIKGIIVGFLILALMIPTLFVMQLVQERSSRKNEVANEISSKWASAQTIVGPFMVIPYLEYRDTDGKITSTRKLAYFLPDQVAINGVLYPEFRHRSIYEIVVYNSEINISGNFTSVSPESLNIAPKDLLLNEAYICVGLSDFRGIEDQLNLEWNDSNFVFNAGATNEIVTNGLGVALPGAELISGKPQKFSLKLHLKGSEKLYFTPVGKTTSVHLVSTWSNPSFEGSFLPVNSELGNNKGFTADWKVLHLNRNYPQSWKDAKYDVFESGFGINLLQPVDSYSQTMRSVKYAILFIALSFALYFFIEIRQKKIIHPVQYVLMGLALCIFYTLLLSISEYLRFGLAYFISASATILLITLYSKTLFSTWKIAILFGASLSILYGFIFVLIQLQDNALLFGSIGLFGLLAVVMYYSRKIDWYGDQARINI
jgi:inner membrane protein